MSNQLGRLTQQILTNKSGSGVAYGDVVVVDLANANAFTTTTTPNYVTTPAGVCIEPNGIANNAQGMIAFGGAVGRIALDTAASIGDWIHTFTVAGQGHPHAAPSDAGDFAVALEASSTPKALLIAMGGGGGGGGSDVLSLSLTNKTGAGVNQGDVVYVIDFYASSFDSDTDVSAYLGTPNFLIGVVLDATIGNGATGKVAIFGLVPKINLSASAAIGQYIHALGASSQGALGAIPSNGIGGSLSGDFAQALDAGTSPPALIWNPPNRAQEALIATGIGINLNSGGGTFSFFSVPTGLACVVTRAVCRNASTNLSTASWSFGFNGATNNDVIADSTHVELTGNTLQTVLLAKVGAKVGAAAQSFAITNNTPQGVAATMDVDVFGYFIY